MKIKILFFVCMCAFFLTPLTPIISGAEQAEISIVREVFSSLENGTGSNMEVNDLIKAIADKNSEIRHEYSIIRDKGIGPDSSWSYSNLSSSAWGVNLDALKLEQTNLNSSNYSRGASVQSLAEAIQKVSLDAKTQSGGWSLNTNGDIVTAVWGSVAYENDYGQVVSAGCEASVKYTGSSTLTAKPAIERSIQLDAKSKAKAPNAEMTAQGKIKSETAFTGSAPNQTFRVETSAALFGGGNIHNGQASVKITKTPE